ncbi:TetR/AcrR family transcriptional regulator [Clostridium neuense]|uniref:TetR/AcrR family transcriptional regulator n=1 Tax=Clostridium neuense TaxID=1728934 RepID=A0ABW8TCT7_9CLOT
MSRTNINFDNKRTELANNIWDIFISNGYENTTLALIIKKLGISKGALYHYFSSKEECADAAIENRVSLLINEISSTDDKNLNAIDRLKRILLASVKANNLNQQDEKMNDPSNKIFHQKLMVALIKSFSPIYADIISQGNDEGIFNVKHPLETAEIILTLSNFYLDEDLFKWSSKTMPIKLAAFKETLTKILGTDEKTLDFLNELFSLT